MSRIITFALMAAALGTAAALLGRTYAFPAEARPSEKPRPAAAFIKADEGVVADMEALAPYRPTPSATGAEVGKGSLLEEPSKSDYNF